MISDGGSSDQQVDSSPCEHCLQPFANFLADVDKEWLPSSTHFQQPKMLSVTDLSVLARVFSFFFLLLKVSN